MADELHLKVGDVFAIENPQYVVNPTTRENRFYLQGREEGRREVLREILACEQWWYTWQDDTFCRFCDASTVDMTGHDHACLWLQAQAVKDAE